MLIEKFGEDNYALIKFENEVDNLQFFKNFYGENEPFTINFSLDINHKIFTYQNKNFLNVYIFFQHGKVQKVILDLDTFDLELMELNFPRKAFKNLQVVKKNFEGKIFLRSKLPDREIIELKENIENYEFEDIKPQYEQKKNCDLYLLETSNFMCLNFSSSTLYLLLNSNQLTDNKLTKKIGKNPHFKIKIYDVMEKLEESLNSVTNGLSFVLVEKNNINGLYKYLIINMEKIFSKNQITYFNVEFECYYDSVFSNYENNEFIFFNKNSKNPYCFPTYYNKEIGAVKIPIPFIKNIFYNKNIGLQLITFDRKQLKKTDLKFPDMIFKCKNNKKLYWPKKRIEIDFSVIEGNNQYSSYKIVLKNKEFQKMTIWLLLLSCSIIVALSTGFLLYRNFKKKKWVRKDEFEATFEEITLTSSNREIGDPNSKFRQNFPIIKRNSRSRSSKDLRNKKVSEIDQRRQSAFEAS